MLRGLTMLPYVLCLVSCCLFLLSTSYTLILPTWYMFVNSFEGEFDKLVQTWYIGSGGESYDTKRKASSSHPD